MYHYQVKFIPEKQDWSKIWKSINVTQLIKWNKGQKNVKKVYI